MRGGGGGRGVGRMGRGGRETGRERMNEYEPARAETHLIPLLLNSTSWRPLSAPFPSQPEQIDSACFYLMLVLESPLLFQGGEWGWKNSTKEY